MGSSHKRRNPAFAGRASEVLSQECSEDNLTKNKNQVYEREAFFWSMLQTSIFRCDKNPSSENLIIRDMVARQWREAFQGVVHG